MECVICDINIYGTGDDNDIYMYVIKMMVIIIYLIIMMMYLTLISKILYSLLRIR